MLNQLSLFSDLSNHELEYLSKITTEISVRRGETIFTQGDATRDFFIIKHGQVEISVRDIFNEKKVINILKNGEFFGEMALFDKNSARSANAVAFQNTALYKIPGPEFERLLKEQPTISYKLLGTMSKRLRDFINPTREQHQAQPTRISGKKGKVMTVCSPRSGYGKTTFTTTLAQMIANELPKKVLFLDLDLSYGDGTFLMGVYSPRSIVDLAPLVVNEAGQEEALSKMVIKKAPNLGVLPAPKDMIDAEKVSHEDLVSVINACRKYYDYIFVDTGSNVTDVLLNALDMSDQILFLVDVKDSIAIKSNSLFFQAVSHLNLPDSHISIALSHLSSGHSLDHLRKLLKWPVIGELPVIKSFKQETSSMPYGAGPESEYCNVVRAFARSLLKEEGLKTVSEPGFLGRWFASGKPAGKPIMVTPFENLPPDAGMKLSINEEIVGPLLKEVRVKIAQGFLDQAQEECMKIINICPRSAPVLQVLGEVFFLKRDFAHALDVFEKVVASDPENYVAIGYLAQIKGESELRDQALRILTSRIQKYPQFPDLRNEMGKLLLAFGQVAEAREFFEKAIEINPAYHDARINLALVHGELGQDREAIDQLMGIRSKGVKVYYMLGNFFFKSGRFFESMMAFSRVSEINPHYLETDDRLESLRDYFAKVNNLIEMHSRLASESPDYPDIHYKVGNLYLLVGRREEAVKEFEEALRLKPDYEEARQKLEVIKSNRDDYVGNLIENEEIALRQIDSTSQFHPEPASPTVSETPVNQFSGSISSSPSSSSSVSPVKPVESSSSDSSSSSSNSSL